MKYIATLLFAAFAAGSNATGALVTTTYPTGPATLSILGPDPLEIPGFTDGDALFYTFEFDSTEISMYDSGPYFFPVGKRIDLKLSISAGDLTVTAVGEMYHYFRGAISAVPGQYFSFIPSTITASGFVKTDIGLIDASTGIASLEFSIIQGSSGFYPGPYLYGLSDPMAFEVFSTPPPLPGASDPSYYGFGEFEVSIGLDLGDNALNATASGIVPVPEPSTYGLIGAAALVGLIGLRRHRARRSNPRYADRT